VVAAAAEDVLEAAATVEAREVRLLRELPQAAEAIVVVAMMVVIVVVIVTAVVVLRHGRSVPAASTSSEFLAVMAVVTMMTPPTLWNELEAFLLEANRALRRPGVDVQENDAVGVDVPRAGEATCREAELGAHAPEYPEASALVQILAH
jgi:hypothetical protein